MTKSKIGGYYGFYHKIPYLIFGYCNKTIIYLNIGMRNNLFYDMKSKLTFDWYSFLLPEMLNTPFTTSASLMFIYFTACLYFQQKNARGSRAPFGHTVRQQGLWGCCVYWSCGEIGSKQMSRGAVLLRRLSHQSPVQRKGDTPHAHAHKKRWRRKKQGC